MTPAPARRQQHLAAVLAEVADERGRQHAKWGEQTHPDVDVMIARLSGHHAARYAAGFYGVPTAAVAQAETDAAARAGQCSWMHIAVEELAELVEAAALGDEPAVRTEALQLSAVCVQLVQAIDIRRARRRAAS